MEIIQSNIFSSFPEIICGISTRHGGVSPSPFNLNMSYRVGDKKENVKINQQKFLSVLSVPVNRVAFPQQVHSDKIIKITKAGTFESCDALISDIPNLYLAVTVADCLPIFIYDPILKSVAVVHSGWKGSQLRILSKTIKRMMTDFGSEPKNLRVFIGQSARVCCYEIGSDLMKEFDSKYIIQNQGRKPRLDLVSLNKDILLESSVAFENIEVKDSCTVCDPKLFHSYRRDGKKSGRMMGIIGLKSNKSR